jgi:hypothetical protein
VGSQQISVLKVVDAACQAAFCVQKQEICNPFDPGKAAENLGMNIPKSG